MDYSYSLPTYHPYAEVYRRPVANPFPQGVALGTTGVSTRSAAARLLDLENDFPGKFERRAEINRLKSKRRLEAQDYGLLPHNSWSTYLKPSTPARHYYHPQYTLDNPASYPLLISRYPVRPLRMVQLAPLSVRCIPMPEQNADAMTLEMEADDVRIHENQDARRIQSAIWQSEATDRAIRLCKDRNRIRNQLRFDFGYFLSALVCCPSHQDWSHLGEAFRRIENARLVGPIYSRLGAPEQLGTRQKVLINYHKGANANHTENAAGAGEPRKESRDRGIDDAPAHYPPKKHDDYEEPAVQQTEESQQQSSFSVDDQAAVEPAVEPELEKKEELVKEEEEEEKQVVVQPEKKPKKDYKHETPKEKRRREQQEKKQAAKDEDAAEPASPKIRKEPLTLKIKEQVAEQPMVEPASPDVGEKIVPESPKIKQEIVKPASPVPASPKIKEIAEPASPVPASPKIKEIAEPASPAAVLASPKIRQGTDEYASPFAVSSAPIKKEKIIEPSSPTVAPESPKVKEIIEPLSPKIKERQTPLQSPRVITEKPALVAEEDVLIEPEAAAEENLITAEPEMPSEKESEVEGITEHLTTDESDDTFASQVETQKSAEEVAERILSDVTSQAELESVHKVEPDVERQLSVTSPEVPPGEENDSIIDTTTTTTIDNADDVEPQSPTTLRRLISNVSTRDGDACDPSEWDDADGTVDVELLVSGKKGIVLSASDDAIPSREDHYDDDDVAAPAITTEEPSTEEGNETVVWGAKGRYDDPSRLSAERADEITDISASTNENAEAGSALTGDNAEETLSANGRPLSVDAESLAADDEQILDEALETSYNTNVEPRVEEPDEENIKYDENVEYRSKTLSIEEDE